MQRRVGDTTVESLASETTKFAAPLVLVHGLWCSAVVWRKFMGYLAHRGWTCHALNLRGHGDAGGRDQIGGVRIADYVSDLQQIIALCDTAPVVIGHDLGGLLALMCPAATTRAVVALAPLVPHAIGGSVRPAVLSSWQARIAMWRGRRLPPPKGKLGAEYFATVPPGGATADSTLAARELVDDVFHLDVGDEGQTLVVAGECDRFSPPTAVERLAQHVRAQFRIAERTGHAMPWATGWEQQAAATHRWIIRTLGEPLLLLRDDEE